MPRSKKKVVDATPVQTTEEEERCESEEDIYVTLESCLLCGKLLTETDRKRRKSIAKIHSLLNDVWKPSEFVWRYVYNMCNSETRKYTIAMCMACTHWTTRSRRKQCACVIPLDQFILFTVAPFHAPIPDGRLLRRLIQSLVERKTAEDGIEYSNTYINLVEPEMLKCFVSMTKGNIRTTGTVEICKRIVAAWWKQNCYTVFVTNKRLAKYIRSMCKKEIVELGREIMAVSVVPISTDFPISTDLPISMDSKQEKEEDQQ